MRIADELRIDCPIFCVDNVADYVDHDQQLKIRDLPSLAPAFDAMWMEYRIPSAPSIRIGALIETRDPNVLQPWGTGAVVPEPPGEREPIAWRLCIDLWRMQNETIDRLADVFQIWLREDGSLIGSALYPKQNDPSVSSRLPGYAMLVRPALLALSFLHCKNVKRVENIPGGKFERARKRRGELPSLKYYTLEIEPMKQVLRTEGRVGEVGLGKALHICRGHFAHYEGKGLFGKYQGTFWRESHVRGKVEKGVVVKDYKVKAPK